MSGALQTLKSYRQADEGGDMVLVSRQAVHEVADQFEALLEVVKSFENDDGSVPAKIWEMREAVLARCGGRDE
jgi:hypothetical protein